MGNQFLSVCKGVNGGDNNNENADQNQQLMKETEKRKQERRIKVNRPAPASVHSTLDGQGGGGDSQQGKMGNYPSSIDGSSQSGIDGFRGNSQKNTMMISREVGSIEGGVDVQLMKQKNRNSINNTNHQNSSLEGSPTKIVDPSPLNKNKKSYDQVELLQSIKKIPNGGITTAGNGLSDAAREEQLVNDKVMTVEK